MFHLFVTPKTMDNVLEFAIPCQKVVQNAALCISEAFICCKVEVVRHSVSGWKLRCAYDHVPGCTA